MLKCDVTSNKMELFEKQNHDELDSSQISYIS